MGGFIADKISSVLHGREIRRANEIVDGHFEQYVSSELIAIHKELPKTRREMREYEKNAQLRFKRMKAEGIEFETCSVEIPSPVRRWLEGGVLIVDEFYRDVGRSEVLAFWVKDSQIYPANEAARTLSPELTAADAVISDELLASELKEISICDVAAYP